MRFALLAILALFSYGLNAQEPKETSPPDTLPWLTGPLLTPSGHVVPVGFYNIEPYVFALETFGAYNNHWHAKKVPHTWSINPQLPIQTGLTDKMDFQISPQFFYNYNHGAHALRWGDFPMAVDYQLVKDSLDVWYPSVKFTVQERFPLGKFQHLDPNKKGTDATGGGSYGTTLALTFSKLFKFTGEHFLATRFNASYTVATNVHVSGLNSYGGDRSTRGTVHPGKDFQILVGMEYTLTRHWALALDFMNAYTTKTRFSGKTKIPVGTRNSSDQISLAPAIEYNFNENIGIIAGAWFSIAGRNSAEFAGGVIAMNFFEPIRQHKHHGFHSHGGRKAGGCSGGHASGSVGGCKG